jgi:hypothetical protein
MNKQTERVSMTEILSARYILQRRSDDHLIARDAVEPDHRSGNVPDSFLALRTQQEAKPSGGRCGPTSSRSWNCPRMSCWLPAAAS